MAEEHLSADDKATRLKTMLAQIAGPDGIESVAAPGEAMLEMAAGEHGVDSADVHEAVQKLDAGADLGPHEMNYLEAIVLPNERPVAYIRRGKYSPVPQARWQHLNAKAVRQRIEPLFPAIGRVEVPGGGPSDYYGTAFVVGENLLMTNRHVGEVFTTGVGTKRLRYRPDGAAVDFQREDGVAGSKSVRVTDVVMIHPYWDMALLKVTSLPAGVQPLKLAVEPPEAYADQDVLVVGYPARDDRSNLAVQDQIFESKYGVKRLQPGKARRREAIDSFKHPVDAMTHDASTLGGNSGSVVIDVRSGLVIGLHFAGVYLKANYAVPTSDLARDARVVDAGLNFAGRIAAANTWGPYWTAADGGEAVGPVPAGPAPPPNTVPAVPQQGSPAVSISAGGVTVTVPLHITIAFGTPVIGGVAPGSPPAPPVVPPAEVEKVPTVLPGLTSRKGFRPDFLQLADHASVPMPVLTAAGKSAATKVEGGGNVLKYHKFSIVMHRERRLALFTAANVDWRPEKRQVGGRRPTRKELNGFDGAESETWVLDPRIPADRQLPDVFYSKDQGAFDKGHLVRRDDVAYGDDFADMQMSNGDTFHVTNCSPQTAAFNRPKPSAFNWGALEEMIQKQTGTEKVCVFSGPVFAPADRFFHGKTTGGGDVSAQIPSRFWKIIVANDGGSPAAFGFVLDQDLAGVPLHTELAVPDRWRSRMTPIADIETLLGGLIKLSSLKDFDQSDS